MRNSFFNDEFENYLQNQVKQHRMYPSDHVWRNIQNNLHGDTRWPALTFISIFIIVSLVVGTWIIKPDKINKNTVVSAVTELDKTPENKEHKIPKETISEHLAPDVITKNTLASVFEKIAINVEEETEDVSISSELMEPPAKNDIVAHPLTEQKETTEEFAGNNTGAVLTLFPRTITPFFNSSLAITKENFGFAPPEPKTEVSLSAGTTEIWRNFAVTNAVKLKSKLPKFDYQFYITPSVSYRRLVDKKSGMGAQSLIGIPVSASYTIDVNQIVRHRPALGTEVGFAVGYKLNRKLTVKTGLQFNIRRYNIEAYSYNNEASSIPSFTENGTDTLNTFSAFSNYTLSSKPIVLSNTYYELSVPLGVDWQILSAGKLGWNVAASVQPTYTFDKEPFVMTSDYKNYADGSSLMRNWNINSNFETYISYKLGKFKWQLGPQFRYQHLPTLSDKYPIREYLLDYGVKFGFTKTIK